MSSLKTVSSSCLLPTWASRSNGSRFLSALFGSFPNPGAGVLERSLCDHLGAAFHSTIEIVVPAFCLAKTDPLLAALSSHLGSLAFSFSSLSQSAIYSWPLPPFRRLLAQLAGRFTVLTSRSACPRVSALIKSLVLLSVSLSAS